MPTFGFNKLVRDKLPGIYDELNQKIVFRRIVGRELLLQQRAKLVEEAEEIPIDGNDRSEIISEISDAQQVIDDMKALLKISDEEVEAARLEKFNQKGGFLNGVFVEMIELKDGDPWIDYYRKEPHKYREHGQIPPAITPGVYVHYKSDDMRYQVLGVGRNTETNEDYVVYRPLYETDEEVDFWVRPYGMFIGQVEVNGSSVNRFRKLDS